MHMCSYAYQPRNAPVSDTHFGIHDFATLPGDGGGGAGGPESGEHYSAGRRWSVARVHARGHNRRGAVRATNMWTSSGARHRPAAVITTATKAEVRRRCPGLSRTLHEEGQHLHLSLRAEARAPPPACALPRAAPAAARARRRRLDLTYYQRTCTSALRTEHTLKVPLAPLPHAAPPPRPFHFGKLPKFLALAPPPPNPHPHKSHSPGRTHARPRATSTHTCTLPSRPLRSAENARGHTSLRRSPRQRT
ncbi:hypothetical protein FB451DRAFT_1554725 [Mycena latifolia]|nr:hypothetical protein FB451DRAFT_1567245 [Mycena latifolia]KAJ7485972.1 hypothetical protein FB451DRAFT_1554725 [Mycena latifolia]